MIIYENEELNKAYEIASMAHKNQKDKGGIEYINHPVAVSTLVGSLEEKIVALLHDVIEDTRVTLEELKSFGFNDNVIAAIDAISKKAGESTDDYMNRVKNNKLACSVKKADLLHNMDISRLKVVNKKDLERFDKYQYIYNYLCT
jgi:GTP diphosphokinase / guanosine-3',5'-bis(diphosphate) 3'-diphosphatase